jgi:hypothetical protein
MAVRRRWRRPYPHPELWIVAALVLPIAGVLVLPALAAGMAWIAGPVVLIALALALRIVHTGLFVGPAGIRIRTIGHTSTYEWALIADFVTVREGGRRALVIQLHDGWFVPTPIFIERVGRDLVERYFLRQQSTFPSTQPHLGRTSFERAVETLRLRQSEAAREPFA